jgi:predicted transcriptional regulator
MLVFDRSKTSRYRSKPDIVASILSAAIDKPLAKTRLQYSSYISSNQVRDYVAELIEKQLLSYNAEKRTFQTTQQGVQWLKLYNAMQKINSLE